MQGKIRASHIICEKQSKCLLAMQRLKAGEPFAKVALEMSEDSSRKRGGDLGFFGKGQMVKPFEDAVSKLQVGEMTPEPIKTGFGWHIIKRTA